MDNKINAWLEDILRSIDEIFDFLPQNPNFLEFQKDIKTKKAVERNIEIIGEKLSNAIIFLIKRFNPKKTGFPVFFG